MGGPLPVLGTIGLEAQIHGDSLFFPLCPSEEGWWETMGPTVERPPPGPVSSKKAQERGLEPGQGWHLLKPPPSHFPSPWV